LHLHPNEKRECGRISYKNKCQIYKKIKGLHAKEAERRETAHGEKKSGFFPNKQYVPNFSFHPNCNGEKERAIGKGKRTSNPFSQY